MTSNRWIVDGRATVLVALAMAAIALFPTRAAAQFVVYEGDSTAHAAWLSAAGGSVPMETFEGYLGIACPGCGVSDSVSALPVLGITFESDTPDVYPGVYAEIAFAHSGANQLANFGAGMGNSSDYRILAAPGLEIVALGFWQCDPQGDQPMRAYDADGNLVGEIVGHINDQTGNGFAGFVSEVGIVRVEVPGALGDGWDHIDDLQVLTVAICPSDFDKSGFVDLDDYVAFVHAFEEGIDAADFDKSGFVDTDDFDAFVHAFEEGC